MARFVNVVKIQEWTMERIVITTENISSFSMAFRCDIKSRFVNIKQQRSKLDAHSVAI